MGVLTRVKKGGGRPINIKYLIYVETKDHRGPESVKRTAKYI